MERNEKLREKLMRGSITASELRAFLRLEGWLLDRTRGSHEFWGNGLRTFVLATHDKNLKRYQIKQARQILLAKED
jgi:predicted RNA binding protein YcfA (HicA-like mRNA interferase family)